MPAGRDTPLRAQHLLMLLFFVICALTGRTAAVALAQDRKRICPSRPDLAPDKDPALSGYNEPEVYNYDRLASELCPTEKLIKLTKGIRFATSDGKGGYSMLQNNRAVPNSISYWVGLVKAALPYAINREILQFFLANHKVAILLLHGQDTALAVPLKTGGEEVAGGGFHPANNPDTQASFVSVNMAQVYTYEMMLRTLANEFHHLIAMTINYNQFTTHTRQELTHSKFMKHKLMPFLSPNGSVSQPFFLAHKKALTAGFHRIEDLQSQHNKSRKSSHEKHNLFKHSQLLTDFYEAIQAYTPATYTLAFDEKKYNSLLMEKPDKSHRQPIYSISGNTVYIYAIDRPDSLTSSEYQVYCSYAGGSHFMDKANAFFKDFAQIKSDISSVYALREEKSRSENLQSQGYLDAEWSSFIEPLPSLLKQTLFPEWCEYFESRTQISGYCSLERSSQVCEP
jgi:hypothetical protein